MKGILFSTAVAFGVGLDQLSKVLVFQSIPMGQTWPFWPNLLHFTPSENPGVAFSWFRDYPMLVIGISIIAVPILLWWVLHGWKQAPRFLLVSQALLLVGAFGNLIDRVLPPHHVRDFLDFRPEIPLIGHWAIFNVADVCICVGAGLLLIFEFFLVNHEQADKDPPDLPQGAGETASQ